MYWNKGKCIREFFIGDIEGQVGLCIGSSARDWLHRSAGKNRSIAREILDVHDVCDICLIFHDAWSYVCYDRCGLFLWDMNDIYKGETYFAWWTLTLWPPTIEQNDRMIIEIVTIRGSPEFYQNSKMIRWSWEVQRPEDCQSPTKIPKWSDDHTNCNNRRIIIVLQKLQNDWMIMGIIRKSHPEGLKLIKRVLPGYHQGSIRVIMLFSPGFHRKLVWIPTKRQGLFKSLLIPIVN